MSTPHCDLESIKQGLASADASVRRRAMQDLSICARKDASLHAFALPIFQEAIRSAPDSWSTLSAARGIEAIAGESAARSAWLTLLHRPEHDIVWRAAMAIDRPQYAPDLLGLIARHSDNEIRTAAIRSLGRMRIPAGYETLIAQLGRDDLRAHTIEALADLGDPRAVPHIKPFLSDLTDAWPEDNHGPMLRVCDLAQAAISRLGKPNHPDNLLRQQAVVSPPALVALSSPLQRVPPIGNPRPRRSSNWLAYVPLVLALLEVPWFGVMIIQQLYRTGTFKPTTQETHRLDLIAAMPALAGVLIAIVVLTRAKETRWYEMLCLAIGLVLCGLVTFCFGWEFFH